MHSEVTFGPSRAHSILVILPRRDFPRPAPTSRFLLLPLKRILRSSRRSLNLLLSGPSPLFPFQRLTETSALNFPDHEAPSFFIIVRCLLSLQVDLDSVPFGVISFLRPFLSLSPTCRPVLCLLFDSLLCKLSVPSAPPLAEVRETFALSLLFVLLTLALPLLSLSQCHWKQLDRIPLQLLSPRSRPSIET